MVAGGYMVFALLFAGCMALFRTTEPTEVDQRDQGYTDCSDWRDYAAVDAEAECFENGELVNFYDSDASRGHYDPR